MAKLIETVVLDSDGYDIERIECQTVKEAKARANRILTDDWAKTATEGAQTHTDLRTQKAEVRVDGECVWDKFYAGGVTK